MGGGLRMGSMKHPGMTLLAYNYLTRLLQRKREILLNESFVGGLICTHFTYCCYTYINRGNDDWRHTLRRQLRIRYIQYNLWRRDEMAGGESIRGHFPPFLRALFS